ncbi:MAG: hydrolase [Thalassobius sp.]|nr:hydrolase [Thalassovita sp.]
MKKILLVANLLILLCGLAYAQKKNENFQLLIQKTTDKIIVDGILDEEAWKQAEVAEDFYMILPMDTSYAESKTVVRMSYNDQFLYISAELFEDLPGNNTVESLRRDFSFGSNDNFLVFIDPFDDQTNGFSFGANAAGAQWDGLMANGGSVELSWDNKWYSTVKQYTDKWVFEAAIPFKTIRYKKGITKWGINFSRLDLKRNEKSSWAPVPRQFPSASLAYTGILQWDAPPPEAGMNVSVIPYVLADVQKNHESGENTKTGMEVGGDAKISITSSLNLDLTVNPDFSQVEVDRQVTNLSRFELFFPERRQFFLENSDLFANFGTDNLRPFFSRRIGLNSPIRFGARLSGKLNKNWRIGAMNIQTEKVDSLGMPAFNYAVAAIQRQVFARSNISLIYIDKAALNYTPAATDENQFSKYNRNLGLEYNLASANNFWTGKMVLHKNFRPDVDTATFMHATELNYDSKNLSVTWQHEYVGENYNPETGYIPRKDYIKGQPEVSYRFFPQNWKGVVSHGPFAGSSLYFTPDVDYTESESYVGYGISFLNRSSFDFWVANNYLKLRQDFDPTNSGGDVLLAGTDYSWNSVGFTYASKPYSLLTYELLSGYGGYFEGDRLNFDLTLGYRFQPYVSLSSKVSYNKISLPAPLNSADFWLVSPRLDITFTNKMFLTTFLQYNSQADNTNLNVRFQWRYQPASDLYIVYTDNYFPEDFTSKNRALVLKFTYWWNI